MRTSTLQTKPIPLPNPKYGTKMEDLSGKVFGRLTVVGLASLDKRRRPRWLCVCICGKITNSLGQALRNGTAKSCGCYASEVRIKHGEADNYSGKVTAEYRCLHAMIQRCTNPGVSSYPRYGGKGIKVCDEWSTLDKFPAFLAYVGRRPTSGHSIDRWPNRDGDYAPGNVRWATKSEQAENRHSSVFISYKGETRCIAEFARRFDLKSSTLSDRLEKGWPVELALITPPNPKNRHLKLQA